MSNKNMFINYSISKWLSILILPVLVLMTGGCSSVTKGSNQEIFVETQDVDDANCTLANEKGTWTVENTPGYATIARGGGGLMIECSKPEYHTAETLVSESVEEMTFGNILVGGLIGLAVDAASGAAYKYPATVSILMKPMLSGSQQPIPSTSPATSLPLASKPAQQVAAEKASLPTLKTTLQDGALKRLQGNWVGFEGNGCIDIGSSPAAVNAFARVHKDLFQLLLNFESQWRDTSYGYRGEGIVPASRKLIFDKPFQDTNEAIVSFEKRDASIYVTLDRTCRIRLKRTNKQTIPQNFKGKSPRVQEASLS
ncbi:MAG: hypothetical protein ABJN43_11740, partial [Sneathiella sp.]